MNLVIQSDTLRFHLLGIVAGGRKARRRDGG